MAERIGFVVVGRMGANMARRLKDAGYPVVAVYDVRAESAQAIAQELGSRAATRLSEVTEASDVIITVVTDDRAMEKIFGPPKKGDSLLTNAQESCSSIAPPSRQKCTWQSRRRRRKPAPNRWRPVWLPASPRRAKGLFT